jgi:hypothetical protein
MENLHVLPTDKPSRLKQKFYPKSFYSLSRLPLTWRFAQHIYITSNEEISGFENNIWVYNNGRVWLWENTMALRSNNKPRKIILTTDQDLIKDGVQAIDNEFLEWFVNNPSCEEVKIEGHVYKGQNLTHYKIIIPKEEPKFISGQPFLEKADEVIVIHRPKQDTFIKTDNVDGQWLSPVPTERAWQEEKLVEIFEHYPKASPKWQYMNGLIQNSLDAKQMYSEQELRNAMNWMLTQYFEFYEWPAMGRVNHYIQTIKLE